MTQSGKTLLGAATAVQLVAAAALFFASLDLTLLILVVVLQAALALIYLWDVGRNERVPDGTERVWRLQSFLPVP